MSEYEIREIMQTADAADTYAKDGSEKPVFRHSKKRHERRTLTGLHLVLVIMSIVWLVPFFFLICQSGRSFVLEGGGMVNYVMPRQGFSLDNYKGLFIKNFNVQNYMGTSLKIEDFTQSVAETDIFSEAEQAKVAVIRDYWENHSRKDRLKTTDKLSDQMKKDFDAGKLSAEQAEAYQAVFTGEEGRAFMKRVYSGILDEHFTRDFRNDFLPWWGVTFLIALSAAALFTLCLYLLRLLLRARDITGPAKWFSVLGIALAVFFAFLIAVFAFKGFSIPNVEMLVRTVMALLLLVFFGFVAASAFLKEDSRLLRSIPGYPAQGPGTEIKRILAFFGEMALLFVILVCMLVPLKSSNFVAWYGNTLTIALFVAVIQTVIVLSVSYALSRIRFKGRKLLMNIVLVLGMFPGFLTMIVLYFLLKQVGLTQSGAVPGLILIYCASSGMGYYISKGFFDTIPKSLDESARIDGATRLQVFMKIIMPLAKPIVIYTILMAFMAPWGDFVFASYVAFQSEPNYNVAVGLYQWIKQNDKQNYFTLFCAGGVLVAVPITALFLALQKYYVEGVTGGAVKG